MSEPLQFTLSPAEFERLRHRLNERYHLEVPESNSGELETNGVTLSYEYDGRSTLLVRILHKPLLVPTSSIALRLHEWLLEAEEEMKEGAD